MSIADDWDGRIPRFLIERESPRRPLKATATVRSALKGHVGGRLFDISERGCKIELYDASVPNGHKITIKLDGLELWVGYVRWANGPIVGVYFERPMHPAIVDHLSRSNPTIEVG
jgi:hypothetical protein